MLDGNCWEVISFHPVRTHVFLIDQIQQIACTFFQTAKKEFSRLSNLWQTIRTHCQDFMFKDWHELFSLLIYGIKSMSTTEILDTS